VKCSGLKLASSANKIERKRKRKRKRKDEGERKVKEERNRFYVSLFLNSLFNLLAEEREGREWSIRFWFFLSFVFFRFKPCDLFIPGNSELLVGRFSASHGLRSCRPFYEWLPPRFEMLVARSFDLWQKDAFFSAAEEVQESADMWVLYCIEGLGIFSMNKRGLSFDWFYLIFLSVNCFWVREILHFSCFDITWVW